MLRKTDKQTVSNVLPASADIVGVGNNIGLIDIMDPYCPKSTLFIVIILIERTTLLTVKLLWTYAIVSRLVFQVVVYCAIIRLLFQ